MMMMREKEWETKRVEDSKVFLRLRHGDDVNDDDKVWEWRCFDYKREKIDNERRGEDTIVMMFVAKKWLTTIWFNRPMPDLKILHKKLIKN